MADEQQRTGAKEIAELLSDFLLNAEVSNTYTLDEFKELFPLKFRDHEDVKQLYQAFQSKRKKLRAVIRKNVARYCSSVNIMSLQTTHSQNHSSSIPGSHEKFPDNEQEQLEEKLASVKKEIKTAESQFIRCAKLLSDINILQGLSGKDLHVDKLQLLQKKLEKPD